VNINAVWRAYAGSISYCSDTEVLDVNGNPIDVDPALVEAAQIDIDWDNLRNTRDRLLAETDWVVARAIDASNDGPGIQLPQVWVDYRQALRDLPANTVDPANPVWPVKPS